jgi:hypothetical protein
MTAYRLWYFEQTGWTRGCVFKNNARVEPMKLINILPAALISLSSTAWAIDSETWPVLAFRATTALSTSSTLDFNVSARAVEGFQEHEREIAEIRYGKRFGSNEFMASYNIQFDRNGAPGSEHRLWQQIRHQFALDSGSVETSLRVEERYFDATDAHGSRLRWLTRRNWPLSTTNQVRLGYEWVYNLNDISASTQRGTSQDRLIGTFQHNLVNGDRVELEYQLRLLHVVGADNRLQNQLQLMYIYNF